MDLWLILISYYESSDGLIKYNNILNEKIMKIKSGVKQGGVISPVLFNYFIHELIKEILALDGGCKIGDTTILAYCDGIILLSHSLKKLEELIKICVRYSTEWLFKFNANKSLTMNCGYKIYENNQIQIRLGEKMLETKDTCKYLGLLVNEDNDGNKIVIDKFKSVRKSFFSLNSLGMKPRGLNPFIKSFLYNSYCLPKLTYGMGYTQLINKHAKF
jgi:hypothetical protein